ncbi:MAG: hypothetical protein ACREVK_04295, partial [Gammaproteobacteria bacterium]
MPIFMPVYMLEHRLVNRKPNQKPEEGQPASKQNTMWDAIDHDLRGHPKLGGHLYGATSMTGGVWDLPWWGCIVYTLIVTHITIVAVTVYLHRCQA